MSDPSDQPDQTPEDASALAKLAREASDQVRAEAVRMGSLLPVWRRETVVYLDPVSLEEVECQPEAAAPRSSPFRALAELAPVKLTVND